MSSDFFPELLVGIAKVRLYWIGSHEPARPLDRLVLDRATVPVPMEMNSLIRVCLA